MSHLRNDLLCGRQNKDRSLFLILSEKPVSPLFLQKIPPDAVLFAWVMGDFFLVIFTEHTGRGHFCRAMRTANWAITRQKILRQRTEGHLTNCAIPYNIPSMKIGFNGKGAITMGKKALVAMSGGVDSSVAAACMVQRGWDCVGVTMKLYQGEPGQTSCSGKTCCTLDDAQDARSVAYQLGMPFYVFNFTQDFNRQVVERFVKAYQKGHTPNPCIDCNRFMKFDKLYQRAQMLGCDAVVTGHYACIEQDPDSGRWLLKKSRNRAKDQSYVLYFLTQEQLAHTVLPLGAYTSKEQVRQLAAEYGFTTAHKPDSQDICFVQGGRYQEFICRYTGEQSPPGDFVNLEGRVLGRHKGLIGYTIGQRKGLGLAVPEPLYVCGKRVKENQVVLCTRQQLVETQILAEQFNWISMEAPKHPIQAWAKTRYHGPEVPCTAQVLEDGRVEIRYHTPQPMAAPGQAVVLYQEDVVVGGGTICSAQDE